LCIRPSNGVTLDFVDENGFAHHHYAFLVGDAEFDAARARIPAANIDFYADFNLAGRGRINHLYGGRGFYLRDPNAHLFELITEPFAAVPERWTEAAAEQPWQPRRVRARSTRYRRKTRSRQKTE
jgi:hypothetical protein